MNDTAIQAALQRARDVLANPESSGHDCTRARIETVDAFGECSLTYEAVKLRRALGEARRRADARDGLRPNGRPRKPVGYLSGRGGFA